MARRKFEAEIPEGTHVGLSKDTDGAYRGHLFDNSTNKLVGHAELFDSEGELTDWGSSLEGTHCYGHPEDYAASREFEERDAELASAVGNLLIALGIFAAPHVKRWWGNQAQPLVMAAWKKAVRRHGGGGQTAADDSSATAPSTSRAFDGTILIEPVGPRVRMTAREVEDRLLAALLARRFSDEQLRLLRDTLIVSRRRVV